jgi:hypothetical protein
VGECTSDPAINDDATGTWQKKQRSTENDRKNCITLRCLLLS